MDAIKSEPGAWKTLKLKLFVPPRAKRILLGLVGVGKGDYQVEKSSLCAFDEIADLSEEEISNQLEQVKNLVYENTKNTDIDIFNKALNETSLELRSTNSQFGFYSILSLPVHALGSGHSSLLLDGHGASTNTPTSRNSDSFLSDSKSPGISIINMPSFVGVKYADLNQYVDKLRKELQKQEDRVHCGWVVDLRQHGGGNVWPMLELLAPLIGEGKLGYIETKGHEDPIDIRDGHIYFKGKAVFGGKPIHRTNDSHLWFIVSNFTASSAEAITIFGKRSRNSQILGVKTSGFTSSNKVFPLSGGGRLVLTTSRFLDEEHKPYPEGVYPDIFVKDILNQNEFDSTIGKLSDLCR